MARSPLCTVSFLCLALSAGTALAEAPPEDRQHELLYRLRHDCGSCHGMTLKGGLGPPLLPTALSERTQENLVEVILDGIPGTPMPPWDFEIAPEEAVWLVERLKEGLPDAP